MIGQRLGPSVLQHLTTRPARTTAITGLIALMLPAAGLARTIDKSFSERFEVEPGHRLELDFGDGDVTITPWSENAIAIEVHYLAEITRIGPGSDGDFDVDFRQRGKTVSVSGKEPKVWAIGVLRFNEKIYEYNIQAPEWLVLDLRGDDGKVTLSGWRAETSIVIDDGDVDLEDIHASVSVSGEDGNIDMRHINGAVDIRVDDGDVTVRESRLDPLVIDAEDGEIVVRDTTGRVRVTTDDGDIRIVGAHANRIEAVTDDGSLEIGVAAVLGALELIAESDDGDIEISLAASIGARFDVRMDDGDVDIEAHGAIVEVDEDHRVKGSIGNGSGRVDVITGDGNVTIRSE